MKKLIICSVILCGMIFGLAACGDPGKDEVETYLVTEEGEDGKTEPSATQADETEYFTNENGEVLIYNEDGETEFVTITAPSTEEMSPRKKDVSLPYDIEYQLYELKNLKVIDPKDSMYPDTNADIVYKKDDSEYFYYTSGELIRITRKEDNSTYACYYNADGLIKFCSDDTMSWYFNEDKEIEHIVYTYYNAFSQRNVYTFYSTEGERLYVGVDGIYYDASFDQLEGEEYERFLIEYSDTQELVAGN